MGEEWEQCPFCGGFDLDSQVFDAKAREGVPTRMVCCDCGAAGPWDYETGGSRKHVQAWNKRVEPKPLAWTKERPTEAGWYFTRQRDPGTGDPYGLDCEYFDEDDRLRLPSIYFDDREFAGPIPEPKEAS